MLFYIELAREVAYVVIFSLVLLKLFNLPPQTSRAMRWWLRVSVLFLMLMASWSFFNIGFMTGLFPL